jgi:hypothetical protein
MFDRFEFSLSIIGVSVFIYSLFHLNLYLFRENMIFRRHVDKDIETEALILTGPEFFACTTILMLISAIYNTIIECKELRQRIRDDPESVDEFLLKFLH